MSDDDLRHELEGIWARVRGAFADYRLDEALPFLQLPEGAPRPTRDQARQLAGFMPDLAGSKFLSLVREGDRAGLYAETGSDAESVEVTVLRFEKIGDAWKIGAPPHSFSSYSGERKTAGSAEELAKTRPELKLVPEP